MTIWHSLSPARPNRHYARVGADIYIAFHEESRRVKVGLAPKDGGRRQLPPGWEILYRGPACFAGAIEAVCHVRMGCRVPFGGGYDTDPRQYSLEQAVAIAEDGGGRYWQRGAKSETTDRWTVGETIDILRQTFEELDGEAPDWLPRG